MEGYVLPGIRRTVWVWALAGMVALVVFAALSSRPAAAEEADLEDLEEISESKASKGGGGPVGGDSDTESLADLEKVLEAQDDRGKGSTARPRGADADDEDSLPPSRSTANKSTSEVESTSLEEMEPAEMARATTSSSAKNDVMIAGSAQGAPPGEKNTVSNLEFKMDGTKSRLVVVSRYPLQYREVRNPGMRQIVYYFDNTEVPDRLQRAYDTTEFRSPVALFTILQMPRETPPQSKLIVQLREEKAPSVTSTSRGLVIEFPPPEKMDDTRLVFGEREGERPSEENIYSDSRTYNGRVIRRLEIKNSDVQDVLRLIAKTSGHNIVVGDDVSGKVGTLSLENVPWDQAFALVLQTKKLGYVKQGNVIRVATLSSLKSEKDEALQSEQARLKVEPLRTVLIPISYAKASELAPQAKTFLTERGAIDTDSRTNTVIVKDIDRAVTRVQKLIGALDTQPPRVSIAAKIVEIGSRFTRQLGMNSLKFSTAFSGLNVEEQFATGGSGASLTKLTSAQFANLEASLNLGELDQKVKTLANPTVTVVANRQATVSQSFSFFVPTNEVAGGQLVPSSRQVTTNLTLDVTPIVAGDGSIFMTVNIRNEIPNLKGKDTTIDSRNISTQVLIENGDTAVIGGVFQNTVNTDIEGIPLLMRVPVLGLFFSQQSLRDVRNEVFVFLTAKITNADESFKRTL